MKKQIFYIMFLLLTLASCSSEEVADYMLEKNGIQFGYESSKMKLNYNFMEQYRTDSVWQYGTWNYHSYYTGDSLQQDTVMLVVSLMGYEEMTDKEFKMKTVPIINEGEEEEDAKAKMAKVEFLSSYFFRKGKLRDTIKVVIVRPEIRGDYRVGITFDIDEESAFESGAIEHMMYQMNISNRCLKPDIWESKERVLGEFSEEKYAFIINIRHQLLHQDFISDEELSKLLRGALEKFNQENPKAPKDFTFPESFKPDWWDDNAVYLGDFSDAKKAFMIQILGVVNFSGNTPWFIMINPLKSAYVQYNIEHPDNPLPFTFPEGPKN